MLMPVRSTDQLVKCLHAVRDFELRCNLEGGKSFPNGTVSRDLGFETDPKYTPTPKSKSMISHIVLIAPIVPKPNFATLTRRTFFPLSTTRTLLISIKLQPISGNELSV
jgi:hypothetical protein